MISLLGASGYIGSAFADELRRRNWPFKPLSRKEVDYTDFEALLLYLREQKPEFVINAAGFTGRPNVDACETARADTVLGNAVLPVTVAHACSAAGIPWAHVSSGCIYAGAHVKQQGAWRIEKDLMQPALRFLPETDPSALRGFSEEDEPNFTFRNPPCSFYSGTKALAEEALKNLADAYVWRLRIPFDESDNPRNYLTKLLRYPKLYDNVNSLSHRRDFASACLDLWECRAPFGTYNVTNPGFVTTRQVAALLQKTIACDRKFEFWTDDAEFYAKAAKTPRSNCILDVSKLLSTGVKMRPVHEALLDALHNWKPSNMS